MRNQNNGLDEMQKEQRNQIGNQMFMLMFYALLLSCGLYGFGIRWLEYPVNVMVIITVCMSIYLVRLISLNAYLPPKAQNRKTTVTLILSVVFSIMFANAAVSLLMRSPAATVERADDNSALILMIVSVVGLICTGVAALIKKGNNKNAEED